MRVLVACEESQRVCTAFRKRGHEAFSCDVIEPSGNHPEWHIQADVIPLLNGNCTFTTCDTHTHTQAGRWDMIIAFPPCTDLAVSGARWFDKKRADGRQRKSIEFFCQFLTADCDKIAIENPIGIISGDYITKWFPDLAEKYGLPIKPSQTIQPYEFGEPTRKTTCLWLKGLPLLKPTKIVEPEIVEYQYRDGRIGRYGVGIGQAYREDGKSYAFNDPMTAKLRSKTFVGIAEAIGEQWG